MPTKPCPRCGEPIAAVTLTDWGAETCPHCGYKPVAWRILSLPFASLFVVGVLWYACTRSGG
jgi:endogenous inhibitor of DNA gyrase (YacG/DUF329 family)